MLDLADDSPLKFATCGRAQVIVRIPDHPVLLDIIRTLDRPVAAPSANTSGRVSPTSAAMVEFDLGPQLEGIVDGGISQIGIESTIVDARSENEIFILRPGIIGKEEIQQVLPLRNISIVNSTEPGSTPGSRYRHYAPATPLMIIEDTESISEERKTALLLTSEQFHQIPPSWSSKFIYRKNHLILIGSDQNLNELARNFYQHLASLDHLKVSKAFIFKTDWGTSSLGKALENRIEKIVSS